MYMLNIDVFPLLSQLYIIIIVFKKRSCTDFTLESVFTCVIQTFPPFPSPTLQLLIKDSAPSQSFCALKLFFRSPHSYLGYTQFDVSVQVTCEPQKLRQRKEKKKKISSEPKKNPEGLMNVSARQKTSERKEMSW